MPLFSKEFGDQLAAMGSDVGARQEQAANAGTVRDFLHKQDMDLRESDSEMSTRERTKRLQYNSMVDGLRSADGIRDTQNGNQSVPLTEDGKIKQTFLPGSQPLATPLLSQAIVAKPEALPDSDGNLQSRSGTLSGSASIKSSGISGTGRQAAEGVLLSRLQASPTVDTSQLERKLDRMRRDRPDLVASLYGGEQAPELKAYDSEMKDTRDAISAANKSNEMVWQKSMESAQKATSSYQNAETQAAKVSQMKADKAADRKIRESLGEGKLSMDMLKLQTQDAQKRVDEALRFYGIDANFLGSQGGFSSAVATGQLAPTVQRLLQHRNDLARLTSNIDEARVKNLSTSPEDKRSALDILSDVRESLSQSDIPPTMTDPSVFESLFGKKPAEDTEKSTPVQVEPNNPGAAGPARGPLLSTVPVGGGSRASISVTNPDAPRPPKIGPKGDHAKGSPTKIHQKIHKRGLVE